MLTSERYVYDILREVLTERMYLQYKTSGGLPILAGIHCFKYGYKTRHIS